MMRMIVKAWLSFSIAFALRSTQTDRWASAGVTFYQQESALRPLKGLLLNVTFVCPGEGDETILCLYLITEVPKELFKKKKNYLEI